MNYTHPFPLILLFAIFALIGCGKNQKFFIMIMKREK